MLVHSRKGRPRLRAYVAEEGRRKGEEITMADKDDPSVKPRQHSRHFREEFLEFLDIVRSDVENGADFDRDFGVDTEIIFDPDLTTDLGSYFKRSMLDYKAPGHWQFLFVALTNFVHLQQRGNKPFTRSENDDFLRDMAKFKQQHDVGRTKLCEMWVDKERSEGRHPGTSTTNTTRLQNLLRTLRILKEEGKATPEEIEWLTIIDSPIRRKSDLGGG